MIASSAIGICACLLACPGIALAPDIIIAIEQNHPDRPPGWTDRLDAALEHLDEHVSAVHVYTSVSRYHQTIPMALEVCEGHNVAVVPILKGVQVFVMPEGLEDPKRWRQMARALNRAAAMAGSSSAGIDLETTMRPVYSAGESVHGDRMAAAVAESGINRGLTLYIHGAQVLYGTRAWPDRQERTTAMCRAIERAIPGSRQIRTSPRPDWHADPDSPQDRAYRTHAVVIDRETTWTMYAVGAPPTWTPAQIADHVANRAAHGAVICVYDNSTLDAAAESIAAALSGGEAAPCPWDMDGNGVVNPIDVALALAQLGCAVGNDIKPCDAADLDGDGTVTPVDVGLVRSHMGDCKSHKVVDNCGET